MKILGYHISKEGAINSDGERPGSLPLIEYLLRPKVVGLHKKDASLNLVYLLGVSEESGEPYLTEVPDANRFLEASCKSCYNWVISHRVVTT